MTDEFEATTGPRFGFQRRPTIRVARNSFHNPNIAGLVLYRCYGLDGTLMYIGQSANLRKRIAQHRRHTAWWFAVEHLTAAQYRNPAVLDQDELQAIACEWPYFNQVGKGSQQALINAISRRCAAPMWDGGRGYDTYETESDTFVFPQFKS